MCSPISLAPPSRCSAIPYGFLVNETLAGRIFLACQLLEPVSLIYEISGPCLPWVPGRGSPAYQGTRLLNPASLRNAAAGSFFLTGPRLLDFTSLRYQIVKSRLSERLNCGILFL